MAYLTPEEPGCSPHPVRCVAFGPMNPGGHLNYVECISFYCWMFEFGGQPTFRCFEFGGQPTFRYFKFGGQVIFRDMRNFYTKLFGGLKQNY